MKLELKHLAPYLPYDLKGIYNEYNEENTIVEITGCSLFNEVMHFQLKFKDGVSGLFDEDLKPILRPLSDLEQISPAIWKYGYLPDKNVNLLNYIDIQVLFENHIDVFGLIEKGLAIDINTLNK